MKELIKIQSELKAPKNQKNNFGNYKYRSAEDILEAVKPHLKMEKCLLILTDEIQVIGDRYYNIATAQITNEKGDKLEVKGYAREELTKKGMDSSQITGAASSYARKYALNGMFLIDDNKDSDTTNVPKSQEQKDKEEMNKRISNSIKKAKTVPTLCDIENQLTERGLLADWLGDIEDAKKKIIDSQLEE